MERNKLMFKPNFQLFADPGGGGGEGVTIEIDGKAYGADDIKGIVAELGATKGSLAALQDDFTATQGKYTDLEAQFKEMQNKGKPEIDILKGQLADMEAGKGELEGKYTQLLLDRRNDWLKAAAAKYELEEVLYQDIEITIKDTERTIDDKLKAKKEAIDLILGERAKKNGVIFGKGKPGDGEKSYGAQLGEEGAGGEAERKPMYEI